MFTTLWLPLMFLAILLLRQGANMREWGFWDWTAYTALFLAGLDIAISQTEIAKSRFPFLVKENLGYLPISLIIVATIVFLFRLVYVPVTEGRSGEISNQIGRPQAVSDLNKLPNEKIATNLRLEFRGGQQAPLQISASNVALWYTVWSGDAKIDFKDKKNVVKDQLVLPKTWVFFVLFDKPIEGQQIVINSAQTNFPRTEIKLVTKNCVIFTTFGDDPPPGVLDIDLKY